MASNKNTKPFALDPLKVNSVQINSKDICIYSEASLVELELETASKYEKDQLNFVYLYNSTLFKKVLDILFSKVILETSTKNQFYCLFLMKN